MESEHPSPMGVDLRTMLLGGLIAAASLAPALASDTLSTEPYVWKNVAIGGGGYVTGIICNPTQPGLIYLRTDIGGAYRWDGKARSWRPLLDWIMRRDSNLMGIESLA